jgi:hypothetical protein
LSAGDHDSSPIKNAQPEERVCVCFQKLFLDDWPIFVCNCSQVVSREDAPTHKGTLPSSPRARDSRADERAGLRSRFTPIVSACAFIILKNERFLLYNGIMASRYERYRINGRAVKIF